jgi:hypothetical protein
MDQAEAVLDDVTDVTDATEVQEVAEQQEESAAAEAATESTEIADDDGEIVVSIAGESPAPEDEEKQNEAAWLKDLRKSNKEKVRRIRELEAQLAAAQPKAETAAVVVGAKPTLEACDYDADAYAEKLEQWHERKRQADAQAAEKQKAEQKAQQAWQTRLQEHEQKAASLKVKDFADAADAARDVLSVTQQGIIVSGAENSALVVYALGKNPAKAKELAGIADPIKFAFAVAKLESNLKVAPRKVAPAPEKVVRAAGAAGGTLDNTLERLRAEAAKTGDLSKVMAFKRQQRAQQRA